MLKVDMKNRISFALVAALTFAPLSAQASVELESVMTSYIPTKGQSPDSGKFSSLNFDIQTGNVTEKFDYGMSLSGMIELGDLSHWYLNPKELYIGTAKEFSKVQFILGRKIQDWSDLDQTWQMGLWEPRFRWDYLAPERVGLTGVFFKLNTEVARFTAFGSPVFIPEMGHSYVVEDGKFVGENPWGARPQEQSNVVGVQTNVRYDLKVPPIKDILMSPHFSLRGDLGYAQGPWGSVGYAYKPMNQLQITFDGFLALDPSDPYSDVSVMPQVNYHHLLSVDLGYRKPNYWATASFLYENPDEADFSPEISGQTFSEARSAGLTLGVNVGGTQAKPTQIVLSYLKTWGGWVKDKGKLAGNEGSFFEQRYDFRNAAKLSVNAPLPGSVGNKFYIKNSFLYDIYSQGGIFQTSVSFHPTRKLGFSLGADVLGTSFASHERANAAQSDTFIGRYKTNDRVYGGVSYEF